MDSNNPSETPDSSTAPVSGPAPARILETESLGEHLRKIRIGARIDIHKMAQDTKLTLEYLQAIEKNEFGKIPGETYRKIFLKNVAKYLGLVPDDVYARYLRESGQTDAVAAPADAPPPPIGAIRQSEPPPHAPEHNARTLLIVLGVLLGIFLLIVLAQSGKRSDIEKTAAQTAETDPDVASGFQKVEDSTAVPRPRIETAPPPLTSAAPVVPATPAVASKPLDTAPTPPAAAPAAPAAVAATPPAPATDIVAAERFRPETQGALKVELSCIRDSIWVFSYRNNKTWNNLLKNGESKVFASDSAVYFRLSAPDRVIIRLNGRELPLGRPASAKNNTIRIDSNGASYITKQEWNALLKRR